MEILRSAGFSLFCAMFNACFAVHSFMGGSWGLGTICVVFAGFCFNNYLRSR